MDKNKLSDKLAEPLSLDREFLLLNYRYIKRFPIPVIIILSCIALFAYDNAPKALVVVWFILSVSFILLRVSLIVYLVKKSTRPDKEKINLISSINFVNGLLVASSLYFFFYLPDFERAFQTLLIVVLAVGTTTNNVGYRKAYFPYITVTIIPMSLALIFSPGETGEQWKYILLGVQGFIFYFILQSMGNESFKLFKSSIDLRMDYAKVNRKLETALVESEASNSAKTRFLASASHDLRQPIQSLSLFSAALQSRSLDERSKEIVESMDRSIQIVNKQLETLLDMSKLDAGVVTPNFKIVDAAKIIELQIEQFEPLASKKNLSLVFESQPQVYINTDVLLFERIINNLLGNAIKYTQEGSVVVRLYTKAKQLYIDIQDSGIGIEQAQLAMVYEEFYQVSNPHRDRSEGLGLGLSIVRRLTRLLGMDITIVSSLGKGTTVSLEIPFDNAIEESPSQVKIETELTGFDDMNVLVVDDEKDILQSLKHYLESLNGNVHLAENISEAIEIAKKQRLDLLITDLRLKDNEEGTDCILAIRKFYPELPAIILSGDTAPDRLQEVKKADALFLHKPIDGDALKKSLIASLNPAV